MNKQTKETSHSLFDWNFNFRQAGLTPSAQIDAIAERCKLFRPPSMIFANNVMLIKNPALDFSLTYNAQQALKLINHECRKNNFVDLKSEEKINSICYIPERLFIKHAEKWKNIAAPKDIEICQMAESSDCFFITPFKGLVQGNVKIERVQENVIPVAKLGPQNKMVFYNQGSLYQDELDDNGLIVYDYKFRAMEQCWFGLIRCYVRVDDVAIMILDTRVFWEKGWTKIARQFMVKKNTYAEIKAKNFEFTNGWTMDPNQSHQVYAHLDETLVENEFIHFTAKN